MRDRFILYAVLGLMVLLSTVESLGQVNVGKKMLEHVVVDTVNVSNISISIRVLWLNDTVRIRITSDVQSAMDRIIADMGKRNNTVNLKLSRKQRLNMRKFMKTSFQNCFSYALEKYFNENEHYSQNLFNNGIWLEQGMADILNNSFVRKTSFPAKPRRYLRWFIPDKSILVFRDKSKMLIHALYYNKGVFYSKNGAFKAKEYKSLKDILKDSYKDTEDIVVYKFGK